MHILPFDYQRETQCAKTGLLQLVPLIEQQRAEGPQTLLFDTGDLIQGTPMADVVVSEGTSKHAHPMIAAMTALQYDAMTLGNHDFDYGVSYLEKTLADVSCPVVAANIEDSQGQSLFRPTLMRTLQMQCDDGVVRPLKLGIIGLVTPQIVLPDAASGQSGVVPVMPAHAAAKYAPQLRAAGADIILALCHFGLGVSVHADDTHAALAASPDIDVLMTGHVHGVFPSNNAFAHPQISPQEGTVFGKPCVMAGAYGSHLGQIDLSLLWSEDAWSITGHTAQALVPAGAETAPEDPTAAKIAAKITQAAAPWHDKTRAHFAQTITQSEARIFSHFNLIESGAAQQLIGRAASHTVQAALSQTKYAELPLLATMGAYNAGRKAGAFDHLDIHPGAITLRDIAAIYPYTNPVVAVLRSGAQIRAWVEHAARVFRTLAPMQMDGGPQALLDPQVPPFHFDAVLGLNYTYDLRKPAGSERVTGLTYRGQDVHDDDSFVLATNSFRLGGGGGYPAIAPGDVLYVSPQSTRDSLTRYLTETDGINHPVASVWDFAALGGTTALFETSDTAADLIPLMRNRKIVQHRRLDQDTAEYALTI